MICVKLATKGIESISLYSNIEPQKSLQECCGNINSGMFPVARAVDWCSQQKQTKKCSCRGKPNSLSQQHVTITFLRAFLEDLRN